MISTYFNAIFVHLEFSSVGRNISIAAIAYKKHQLVSCRPPGPRKSSQEHRLSSPSGWIFWESAKNSEDFEYGKSLHILH